MKGAIGNALILNMVITFIIIFFSLLIGSMAYSKAYKVKNYLINQIDEFQRQGKTEFNSRIGNLDKEWDEKANEYLQRVGYGLTANNNSCPDKEGYHLWVKNGEGRYDYCIYRKYTTGVMDNNPTVLRKYNYLVIAYLKLDLPVVGKYLRIPITGETKQYIDYREI